MTCNRIKKCNCTFVLDIIGQLCHVLSGKAFRCLIQRLAMSFLFGLPCCRTYMIELDNEMFYSMRIPAVGADEIQECACAPASEFIQGGNIQLIFFFCKL